MEIIYEAFNVNVLISNYQLSFKQNEKTWESI